MKWVCLYPEIGLRVVSSDKISLTDRITLKITPSVYCMHQSCQVCTTKPAQLLIKTSQNLFWGVRKTNLVASTCGLQKLPAATV